MDIDVLSLQVTGSSKQAEKALDGLISSLTRLDSALGSISNVGAYTSTLDSLASGFDKISGSVANLNGDELKNVASGMRSIATVGKNLSGLSGDPFTSLSKGLQSLEGLTLPDFSDFASLASFIGKLNSVDIGTVSNNLPTLAQGLRQLNGISTPNLTGVAETASGIAKLGGVKVTQAVTNIKGLAEKLNALNGIQIPQISGLQELASSLSIFGRKTAHEAITNIPKISKAFNELIASLSKAPTVNRNIIDLANSMASLLNASRGVSTASTQASRGLRLFTNTTKTARVHTFSLASAVGKVYASYWLLFRLFSKLGQAINLSSQLTEVQNVVDTTFGDMSYKVEEFTDTSIKSFGMSRLSAKQFASRYQAMGSAMGITNTQVEKANKALSTMGLKYEDLGDSMSDVSLNLTKLTADIASFYDKDQAEVAEDLQAIFTGMTRPLREYGLDLTQATLKEWALANGLNANINAMSQAEKTMLRYQYVMAHTINAQGDFQKTINTWANQVRILKMQFQELGTIIGTGLINALKPMVRAFNSALSWLIAKVQLVVNAIGSILGWQMEIQDVGLALDTASDAGDALDDSMGGAADGLDQATKNAKKLKTQLLGIDELNILSPDDDSSGSGSGSALGGLGDLGGGTQPSGNIRFEKYESDIKSWWQLGRSIADTLTNLLRGIDWDSIYQGARDFGVNLADFLNGLITPDLFYELGKTIANSLNTVLNGLWAFAVEFNWDNLGKSIGEGINGFFQNFNWELAADTLNKWAGGLKRAIKKAIETVEWKDVVGGITKFFKSLDVETVEFIVAVAILKKVGKFVIGGGVQRELKKALGGAIGRAFESGGLAGVFASPAFLIPAGVITALVEFGILIDGITDSIENLKKLFDKGFDSSTLTDALQGFNQIKAGLVGFDFGPVIQGIALLVTGIATLHGEFDNIVAKVKEFKANIEEFFENFSIDQFIYDISFQIGVGIGEIIVALHEKWTEIEEWWGEIWEEKIKPWFSYETWLELIGGAFQGLLDKWEMTVEEWKTNLQMWWSLDVAPWFNYIKWYGLFDAVKKAFKEGFKGAVNAGIDILNNGISSIEAFVNRILAAINGLLDGIRSVTDIAGLGIDIPTITKSIKLERLPKFANGGYPETGSLFIANEMGPELVGNIGGRTAVANNEMIVQGIEEAAYRGFARAYSENTRDAELLETLIDAVREGSTISIDGRELVASIDQRRSRNGFAFT